MKIVIRGFVFRRQAATALLCYWCYWYTTRRVNDKLVAPPLSPFMYIQGNVFNPNNDVQLHIARKFVVVENSS